MNFRLQKAVKSNLTLICMTLALALSFGVLYLNARNSRTLTLEVQTEENLAQEKDAVRKMQKDLSKYSKSGDAYKLTKESIAENKKEIRKNQELLRLLREKKWQQAYKYKIADIQKFKRLAQSEDKSDPELIAALNREILLFSYLKKHPQPYQTDQPSKGIQFLFNLNEIYVPIIFALMGVFILSQLATDSYRQRYDLTSLLPGSRLAGLGEKITANFLTLLGMFLLINLLAFILASLFYGLGSWDYPYLVYHWHGGKSYPAYIASWRLLAPALCLQLLLLLQLASLTELIAKIIRDKFPTLLIVLLLTVGLNLCVYVIVPVTKVAQWLPSTYLNCLSVSSNSLAQQVNNQAIDFNHGVITLTVTIIITCFLLLLPSLGKRKRLA